MEFGIMCKFGCGVRHRGTVCPNPPRQKVLKEKVEMIQTAPVTKGKPAKGKTKKTRGR